MQTIFLTGSMEIHLGHEDPWGLDGFQRDGESGGVLDTFLLVPSFYLLVKIQNEFNSRTNFNLSNLRNSHNAIFQS